MAYTLLYTKFILYLEIDEQLKKKDKLYFVSFGTNIDPLWQVPRDVNCRM